MGLQDVSQSIKAIYNTIIETHSVSKKRGEVICLPLLSSSKGKALSRFV